MSEITIRPIMENDAAAYNAHRRRISDEPNNNITFSAGEYTRPIEEDRERILAIIADPTQQIFVAAVGEEIVAICACRGATLSAVRHAVSLGIGIDQPYRGRGLGNKLMQTMIDWALADPFINRIELDVFTINRPAINLYLKHGFEIEGRKKHAYFKYGRYVDTYIMGLILADKK